MKKYNMHAFFSKFNFMIGVNVILIFCVLLSFNSNYITLREVLLAVLGIIFILKEVTKNINTQYTCIFIRVIQFFKQCILSILFFLFRDISIISCICFLLYFYISMEFLIVFNSKKIETRIATYGQIIIPLIAVFLVGVYNNEFPSYEIIISIILFITYIVMLRIIENYLIFSREFLIKSNINPFSVDENSNITLEDDSKVSSRVISRMLGIDETDTINASTYYDRVIKAKDFKKFIQTVDISEDVKFIAKSILNEIKGIDYILILLQSEEDSNKFILGTESIIGKNIITRTEIAAKNRSFLPLINSFNDIYIDNDINLNKYPYFTKGDEINSLIIIPLKEDGVNVGICIAASHSKRFFRESNLHYYSVIFNELVPKLERIFLCRMLEQLAIKDALTGIYNRRYLSELFNEISNNVNDGKTKKFKMSVALFDIDRFKLINDTYGHLFGDRVIKVCAKIAKDITLKNKGIISRYGGEEFVIIFPGKEVTETEKILKQIMDEISSFHFISNEKVVNVNISVGITAYPEISKSIDSLLKDADYAMYYSKGNGRSQITIYSNEVKKYLKMIGEI